MELKKHQRFWCCKTPGNVNEFPLCWITQKSSRLLNKMCFYFHFLCGKKVEIGLKPSTNFYFYSFVKGRRLFEGFQSTLVWKFMHKRNSLSTMSFALFDFSSIFLFLPVMTFPFLLFPFLFSLIFLLNVNFSFFSDYPFDMDYDVVYCEY